MLVFLCIYNFKFNEKIVLQEKFLIEYFVEFTYIKSNQQLKDNNAN